MHKTQIVSLKKVTYWVCRALKDANCYNIRARTKKEANRLREEYGKDLYSKPFKNVVYYHNALHLLTQCLGEGGIPEHESVGE